MQYVLPLMLTVMSARLIGNIFTEGLYDQHIHSRALNFLDEDEGVSKLVELHDLSVCEIMTKRPKYVTPIMTVGKLYDILKQGRHHCYPVVDEKDSKVLVGTVMRKVICTLIKNKAFGMGANDKQTSSYHGDPSPSPPPAAAKAGNNKDTGANGTYVSMNVRTRSNSNEMAALDTTKRLSPLVSWKTLECIYPRYPDVENLKISESERRCIIDLRPYIDSSPYTINEHASVQRTYRMFRTLGLRHLCVINKHNQILGIVTRSDLVSAHFLSDDNRKEGKHRGTSGSGIRERRKRQNAMNLNSFDSDDAL